jgi:hypothetical protein
VSIGGLGAGGVVDPAPEPTPEVATTSSGAGTTSATTSAVAGATTSSRPGATAPAAPLPIPLSGVDGEITPDGAIVPTASVPGGPLALLRSLGAQATDGARVFGELPGADLVGDVDGHLRSVYRSLLDTPPDAATAKQWEDTRAAIFALRHDLGRRAAELGDGPLTDGILDELTFHLYGEPATDVRDGALERLLADPGFAARPEVTRVRDVAYPRTAGAAGGLQTARQPGIPTWALDRGALDAAVSSVEVKTAALLGERLGNGAAADGTWRATGWFDPTDGEHRAFRFSRAGDGALEVSLSRSFAHAGERALSSMLAYEAGLWLGGESGLGDEARAAFALDALGRVRTEDAGAAASVRDVLDAPWMAGPLLRARYGLDGDAAARASRAPQPIAEVKVPTTPTSLPTDTRDEAALGALLTQLGMRGELLGHATSYLDGGMQRLTLTVSRGGETVLVGIDADRDRAVRGFAELPVDVTAARDHAARALLSELAVSGGASPAEALTRYDTARGSAPPGEALLETLADVRATLPPGTIGPSGGSLHTLARLGLVTAETDAAVGGLLERDYPLAGDTGSGAAEASLFAWAEARAGGGEAQRTRLRGAYFGSIALGEDRGAAVETMLRELPPSARPTEPAEALTLLEALDRSDLLPRRGMSPGGSRDHALGALRRAMALDPADAAAEAVRRGVGPGGPHGEEAARAAHDAVESGVPLADAVGAALAEQLERGAPLDAFSLNAFATLGLAPWSDWRMGDLENLTREVLRQAEGERALFAWLATADGARGPEAYEEVYREARRRDPGRPGGAFISAVEALPAGTSLALGGLAPALAALPEAERFETSTAVRAHLGLTPFDAARGLITHQLDDAATRDAALSAFDEAQAAGLPLGDALVRAGRRIATLRPGGQVNMQRVSLAPLLEAHLLPPAERSGIAAELENLQARGARLHMLRRQLGDHFVWGPESTARLGTHAERLSEGAPYTPELLDLVRALPPLRNGARYGTAELRQIASALAQADRPALIDAFCEGQGMTREDLTWQSITRWVAVDDAQRAEGREAFDRALASGATLADAIRQSLLLLQQRQGYALDSDWGDGLEALGLISAAEAGTIARALRRSSGEAAAELTAVAERISEAGLAPEVQTRLTEALARPDATGDAVVTALSALPARQPGLEPVPIWEIAGWTALADIEPELRPQAARLLFGRAGWSLDAVRREVIADAAQRYRGPSLSPLLAAYDGALPNGLDAALAAVREAAGEASYARIERSLTAVGLNGG